MFAFGFDDPCFSSTTLKKQRPAAGGTGHLCTQAQVAEGKAWVLAAWDNSGVLCPG